MTGQAQHQLIFHDLITVPLGNRRPGIYWLRLYESELAHYIATITEVPGNPGRSVANAISVVVAWLTERFPIGTRPLQLYQIWPRDADGHITVSVQRVTFQEGPLWVAESRGAIEEHVGGRLPELPPHDELYARVLALGGGNVRKLIRPSFEAVPVGDLPAPHNPHMCKHSGRFNTIADRLRRAHPKLAR